MSATEAERFVEAFAAAWAHPAPDRFLALFQPEIRLEAPLLPITNGKEEARDAFERLLRLMPDIRGEVHDWAPRADGVYIEFTLSGTIGGRRISWRAVDRFALRDGLAVERVSFFDSAPVLADGLRTPRAWPALLRARVRPRM